MEMNSKKNPIKTQPVDFNRPGEPQWIFFFFNYNSHAIKFTLLKLYNSVVF